MRALSTAQVASPDRPPLPCPGRPLPRGVVSETAIHALRSSRRGETRTLARPPPSAGPGACLHPLRPAPTGARHAGCHAPPQAALAIATAPARAVVARLAR